MNGEDIKRRRISLGWSQERLARELGVSFSTVNRWERGRSEPNGIARKALDGIFQVSMPRDERRSRRIALSIPIRISGTGASRAGLCEDISGGGMMFKTDMPLKAGEDLMISFNGAKGDVLAASEVVWTRGDGGKKRAGARFNGLRKNEFAKIITAALLI